MNNKIQWKENILFRYDAIAVYTVHVKVSPKCLYLPV